MKKYRKIDHSSDIFEVLEVDGREVGVSNLTARHRKMIEGFERIYARQEANKDE